MGRLYPYRSCVWYLRRLRACVVNNRECRLNAPAATFLNIIREHHFDAETYIDVLPQHKLIYLCVPKAASTTIRSILSSLEVGTPPGPSLELLYNRRCTGIRSPRLAGFSVFHRLAESAEALRFTFVRNPYARLLSAWSDRFQGRRLIEGNPSINAYRAHRATISRLLPDGQHQTLSFPQFVEFATATADQRVDIHWQLQYDFATVPGLPLNLIGKVESFQTDFARVLDHIGVNNEARAQYLQQAVNPSSHEPWQAYYTDALAARVYRAYERDFDKFGYPRTVKYK
jgi:hypothetical protein